MQVLSIWLRYLRRLDLTKNIDVAVMQLRGSGRTVAPYSLSFNPAENSILVQTRHHNTDNSCYDLYQVSAY